MRKLLIALLVTACSAVLATQALAGTRTLKVGDDYYVRAGSAPTVTVKKNTRVTWKWVGRDMHNVAVAKGPVKFNSSFKKSGTYRRTMRKRGTYKIICTIHQPEMRMTLKVVR